MDCFLTHRGKFSQKRGIKMHFEAKKKKKHMNFINFRRFAYTN